MYNLEKMTTPELYEWIGGHKLGSTPQVAGVDELRRRNEAPIARRTWWAIAIATLSLLVAVGSLLVAAAK